MGEMGGPVAVNQLAIHAAMELYGVEFKQDCFDKVVRLSRYFIRKMRERNDANRHDIRSC